MGTLWKKIKIDNSHKFDFIRGNKSSKTQNGTKSNGMICNSFLASLKLFCENWLMNFIEDNIHASYKGDI